MEIDYDKNITKNKKLVIEAVHLIFKEAFEIQYYIAYWKIQIICVSYFRHTPNRLVNEDKQFKRSVRCLSSGDISIPRSLKHLH